MADVVDITGERNFRRHVCRILACLQHEETDQLGFIYELPEAEYKDKPSLAVFEALTKKGIISATKPEGLIDVLKDVNRMDLVEKTRRYIKEYNRARKKRSKDSTSAADDSSQNVHFKVALVHSVTMKSHLQLLGGVIRESTAKDKVKEAERCIAQARTLIQCAKSLEEKNCPNEEEETTSVGKSRIIL